MSDRVTEELILALFREQQVHIHDGRPSDEYVSLVVGFAWEMVQCDETQLDGANPHHCSRHYEPTI